MSDIAEFTARTLHKLDMGYEGLTEEQIKDQDLHDPWETVRDSYYKEACDLLAIIQPIIRQQVFDELIDWVETHIEDEYLSVGLEWSDISSWLRERREIE